MWGTGWCDSQGCLSGFQLFSGFREAQAETTVDPAVQFPGASASWHLPVTVTAAHHWPGLIYVDFYSAARWHPVPVFPSTLNQRSAPQRPRVAVWVVPRGVWTPPHTKKHDCPFEIFLGSDWKRVQRSHSRIPQAGDHVLDPARAAPGPCTCAESLFPLCGAVGMVP